MISGCGKNAQLGVACNLVIDGDKLIRSQGVRSLPCRSRPRLFFSAKLINITTQLAKPIETVNRIIGLLLKIHNKLRVLY